MPGTDDGFPPGWFPDPAGAPALRWWDGQAWTGYLAAVPTAASGPPPWGAAPMPRRLRALQIASAATLLAVPVDLLLLDWISNASTAKADCAAPLPWYQNVGGSVVPSLFVLLALTCLVIGIVTRVRGTRELRTAARDAGTFALIVSIAGLVVSVALGLMDWLVLGFSTWCF